jgi:hypothetical protein
MIDKWRPTWNWIRRGGWAALIGLFLLWSGQQTGPEKYCDDYEGIRTVCVYYDIDELTYPALQNYAHGLEKALDQTKDSSWYGFLMVLVSATCFWFARVGDADKAEKKTREWAKPAAPANYYIFLPDDHGETWAKAIFQGMPLKPDYDPMGTGPSRQFSIRCTMPAFSTLTEGLNEEQILAIHERQADGSWLEIDGRPRVFFGGADLVKAP